MIGAFAPAEIAAFTDAVLAKHVGPYLAQLPPETRRRFEAYRRDLRQSAQWWSSVTASADGSAEVAAAAGAGPSAHEVGIDEAAGLMGVGTRQARNVAVELEAQGLARKVGGVWLIDRTAVEVRMQVRRQERVA